MQLSKKQNEYIVNATHRWNISLDAFEYTIERDMKDLIEEVEDV